MYKHGIEVTEKKTSFPQPLSTRYAVQVIVGTAPVNLADDPYSVTNKPLKVAGYSEATALLGDSENWADYTLCQSMYASFRLFTVTPVVLINVLDPRKHKKENAEKSYAVEEHQVVLKEPGILKDSVVVKEDTEDAGAKVYVRDKDFMLTFDREGQVIITLLSAGEAYVLAKVKVLSTSIDPKAVTEEDIIGAYDLETGKETGIELIRQVYPRFGLVPGLLLAPGWSHKPNVGAALMGKCEGIGGVFRSECLLDLDTSQTKKYMECAALKSLTGYTDEHAIILWPKLTMQGKIFYYSAVYGALTSYYTAVNGDVPYIYPSNKLLNVDGAVLEDGMEIMLDQTQAAELNGEGIVTVINDNAWKSWGNNTGCYPDNSDPKDRWIACRRMFSFVANYFAISYKDRLDGSMERRTVDDLVNSFNIWGNSLVASGMCAGLKMEFRDEDNNFSNILEGYIKVRILFAPYTPAEYIQSTAEFDVAALETALSA